MGRTNKSHPSIRVERHHQQQHQQEQEQSLQEEPDYRHFTIDDNDNDNEDENEVISYLDFRQCFLHDDTSRSSSSQNRSQSQWDCDTSCTNPYVDQDDITAYYSDGEDDDDANDLENPMAKRQRKQAKQDKRFITTKSVPTDTTKHSSTQLSGSIATSNTNTNRKWMYAMAAMAIVVGIAASVMAIRDGRKVHIYPEGRTQSPNVEKSGLSLAHAWQDFEGHANISNQYKVIQQLPHDPQAFCQGLVWHDHRLVESTGMYGDSLVRIWTPFGQESTAENDVVVMSTWKDAPETVRIDQEVRMDSKYFGEGLCHYQDEQGRDLYIQLTWKEETAFVYENSPSKGLQVVDEFTYSTTTKEGWGIAFDFVDKVFYVSDGSEWIIVWNLQFQEIRRFQVSLLMDNYNQNHASPYVKLLNELEWDPVDRTLIANVWFQNALLRIHPVSGQVLQVYDLSTLYPNSERDPSADVFNGIAHYRENQWFVTGKYWPNLYLIEL